ncbi:transcriptional regulator [Clavibacter michiganensis]|uniref:transcriptional regulator n=1 Tax=Clavibacter michiganensis TaxID=28447 RepID=UPI001BDFDFBC|nr:transcriptional regulator [Clavibacter michiganensis]MBT1635057.1 transcriptional regulator [Clavibacter michiganensis]
MIVSGSVVAVVVAVVCVAVAIACLVTATEAVRAAPDGTTAAGGVLGLPLFVGFHEGGRIGVHVAWGLAVLVLLPAAATVMALVVGRTRRRATRR